MTLNRMVFKWVRHCNGKPAQRCDILSTLYTVRQVDATTDNAMESQAHDDVHGGNDDHEDTT